MSASQKVKQELQQPAEEGETSKKRQLKTVKQSPNQKANLASENVRTNFKSKLTF